MRIAPGSSHALVYLGLSLLSACSGGSDGDSTPGSGGNGATGSGGMAAASGGATGSSGGAVGASTGGTSTATGGASSGGSPNGTGGSGNAGAGSAAGGNASAGGATSGGATSGGSNPGGTTSGGANAAGAASGGAGSAKGGAANGGSTSGGAANGGASSGGSGTAGSGSGGGGTTPETGQPIGFASMNGGTAGGKGGQVVTATTFAQLKSYAESATTYIIQIQGTISNGADGGKISVKSNKSLIGVGSNAFLNGVGLDINNANNIIVQNLRVSLLGVTTRTDKAGVYSSTGDGGLPQILVNGGDAISISGTSKNVWIDHCELFSENPDTQTNKDLYDGLIDIKGQTGFITISYCYLHDHHKGGLVGAADDDLFADRKVTYLHNYYNKVKLRVPMYRGATGHFFNNYIVGATDATEIRAGTCVRVEKNYYEALHYSIYTTSDSAGSTERIDNTEVSRTSRAYPANCSAQIPYTYSSVLIATADVKTAIPSAAGVGKL